VGTRFFRGSGTSQAAAVTAGAVALFLQRYPMAKPDQVKQMLMSKAIPLKNVSSLYRGSGSVQVRRAQAAMLDAKATQSSSLFGTGRGTLEGARGSAHVRDDGVDLVGEQDIFGRPWNGVVWSAAALARSSWQGGVWNGSTWTGQGWTASLWGASAWTNVGWDGLSWTGRTWSGRTWSGRTWSGSTWSGDAWTGGFWAGRTWTNSAWSTGEWR
jgi:serine protease AprX